VTQPPDSAAGSTVDQPPAIEPNARLLIVMSLGAGLRTIYVQERARVRVATRELRV